MRIEDIVRELIENNPNELFLYRTFIRGEFSEFTRIRANELMDEEPELMDVLVSLYVYPAIKWSLKGQNTYEVMQRICERDERIFHFGTVQQIINRVTGEAPRLILQNRKRYFEACADLVNLLEEIRGRLRAFPMTGGIWATILAEVYGIGVKSDKVTISKYKIGKNLKEMLQTIHLHWGMEIERLLDGILSGNIKSNNEMGFLYHNTDALLKQYNIIVWNAKNSSDRALRLLDCKSEEEMLRITENDEKYRQAYVIVEYIKLINGAIELVREFPKDGEEYYGILRNLIELKSRENGFNDNMISQELEMSPYTFSVKKRRAFAVLGAVLWGCDGDGFIRLLTVKKGS